MQSRICVRRCGAAPSLILETLMQNQRYRTMGVEDIRQTWVEIDLDALAYNIENIKEKVGSDPEIIGVVKADAYGHGAVQVAKLLKKHGVQSFAVATVKEARELRDAGISDRILILGITPKSCYEIIVREGFVPVIGSYNEALALSQAATAMDESASCMIALDTGMGRIGYVIREEEDIDAAEDEIDEIFGLDGLIVGGIISHFSKADEEDSRYTDKQLDIFNRFYEKLSADGYSLPFMTIANSAAIMEYPKAYFDGVRPGIILYGCYPSREVDRSLLDLKPVMSVKANIVYVKKLPEGSAVSYGGRFVADRDMRVATVGIGYADGYPRCISGKAEMLVNGHRVPVLGNICMDQCMIDVTDLPEVCKGTQVTIMGRSGDESITADDLAELSGTINYEILCDFGMRLDKKYIQAGE